MALNFPSSPTLNQVYTSGTSSWIWDGISWRSNNTSQYPAAGIPVSTGTGWDVSKSTTGTGNVVLATGAGITTPIITGLKETEVALAANNIDLSSGNYFTKTITTATTFTVSNVPSSDTAISFILDLTNGGVGAITWWTGVKWVGATPPTLTTSGRDSLAFYTYDGGTTWTGLVLGKDIR